MNVQIAGRAMPQKRIGRCVGIGLVVVACPVALATPLAVVTSGLPAALPLYPTQIRQVPMKPAVVRDTLARAARSAT
jgi:hypothetical protein